MPPSSFFGMLFLQLRRLWGSSIEYTAGAANNEKMSCEIMMVVGSDVQSVSRF